MHNLILGERNANAQQRILVTAGLLAAHFNIDPALATALKVQEKDAVIRAMKEREAIAELLDAIAINLNLIKLPTVTAETGEGLPEPMLEEELPVDKKHKRRQAAG